MIVIKRQILTLVKFSTTKKMSFHEIESKHSHEMEQHNLLQIKEEIMLLREDLNDFKEKSQPMIDWFNGLNYSRKLLMWFLGILAAIGSLILMYKQIFKE